MRLAFTLASLLLLATSATASLHFAPDSLNLRVGDTATINVSFASLSTMGIGLRFTSCDPSVAIANGEVVVGTGSHYGTGTIRVTAVSPGRTTLCFSSLSAIPITVACGVVPDARAANANVATQVSKAVTLSVLFPPLPNTTYDWYLGRAGDRSMPLAGHDADLTFTPQTAGIHRVWALVSTPCSTGSVEFTLNAASTRRRGVRH